MRYGVKTLVLFILLFIFNLEVQAEKAGSAVQFDGKNDMITIPNVINGQRQITIEAWFKYSDTATWRWIYGNGRGFVEVGAAVRQRGNKMRYHFTTQKASFNQGNGSISLSPNTWYHFALTFDGITVRGYINGLLDFSRNISGKVKTLQTQAIGAGYWQNGERFKGYIDEVRIWNYARSQSEIQATMHKELFGAKPGLVAYYTFNELTHDGRVKDLSGRGNHGILHGGARLVPSTAPVKPPYPPELSVSARFSNGILKATESGTITVDVNNSGKGVAENVRVSMSSNNPDIIVNGSKAIGIIRARSSEAVTLSITGKKTLTSGTAIIRVNVSAAEGHSATTTISVPTQALFVKPAYPADLTVENIRFVEPSGNKALDAYETGKIQFILYNQGRGVAQNIHLTLSPLTSAEGIEYTSAQTIELINPKNRREVSFTLTGKARVATLPRRFRVQITEEFGFDADPFTISFDTKAYDPPNLHIEQIAINDKTEEGSDAYGNGNSIIEPNESIVVTAFVQNFGTGKAEDVKAKVILESTDPNISCPDAGKIFPLSDIPPGDYKPVSFYFFTSRRYSAEHIPLKVQLTEARGDFGKLIDLGLKMNVRTQNIVDVRIAKIEAPKPTIKPIAEVAKSDVDNIPTISKTKRPDGFAVIIGIEDYKYAPKATFASRDAEAFYGYATRVLGIPERNVYYRVNDGATAGEFKKLFEPDGWLARRVTANSDVFIYYSGHGAPDIKTKSPYLIPYDIDPNYASTGFPLDKLYKNLHLLKAKSVTVILDACFSGQSREEEMMLADARPVGISIESPLAYGDITVLAAASGRQISSGYPEQRHGLFSYFFLKGLKGMADANGDRKIIVGELFNYLKANVPRLAGRMDREQTPQLLSRDKGRVLVEY